MKHLFSEPPRDPKLADALRRLESASIPGDDEPMRLRILAAARQRLADLRAPAPTWWEIVSGWVRVAVPLGLAAGLAAALLIPGNGELTGTQSPTLEGGTDSTLVLAALSEQVAGVSRGSILIEPESNDWLLEQALSQ